VRWQGTVRLVTVLGILSVTALAIGGFLALAPSVMGWIIAVITGLLGITTGIRAYVQSRRARA
jgi:hypothetical protein